VNSGRKLGRLQLLQDLVLQATADGAGRGDGRPARLPHLARAHAARHMQDAEIVPLQHLAAVAGPLVDVSLRRVRGAPEQILQKLLAKSTARTFNCVTVDGDTSTSDTLLAFATGAAGSALKGLKSEADPRLKDFARALDDLCKDLALQVVKDGEGAEKLIEITVTGAENDRAARKIGMAIANSPLVKTAIAGEDANWGRIVMAIGKSGEKAIRDKLKIWIGGVQVARNGMRAPDYREEEIMPHMKSRSIVIKADVGVGKGRATVWTCDLTHRYIDINGSYRS